MSLISEVSLDEYIGETISCLRDNGINPTRNVVAEAVAESVAVHLDKQLTSKEFDELIEDVKKELPYYAPELR